MSGLGERDGLKARAAELAARGVYLGTSSWKYPGWRGQLYDEARYVHRGRFSEQRFERLCLAEYAEVFATVCVDAAYYRFPDDRFLSGLIAQVPAGFQFGFKVTDEITLRRFTRLPRFGDRAGQANANFLNADRFTSEFLGPCQPYRAQVGLLIFEFSRFYPSDYPRGREFVEQLDAFLGRLPGGWPYGVEIRNRTFLQPEYFAVLARHGVTHVFNQWEAMPSVAEQLELPGSRTTPGRVAARFLLTPGRKYAEAVDQFQPYDRIQAPDPAGRAAGARLIREAAGSGGATRAFIYVNNRFEGNALGTIAAMLEQAQAA